MKLYKVAGKTVHSVVVKERINNIPVQVHIPVDSIAKYLDKSGVCEVCGVTWEGDLGHSEGFAYGQAFKRWNESSEKWDLVKICVGPRNTVIYKA